VKLVEKVEAPTGFQLKCMEYNEKGEAIERLYWPSHTSDARYDAEIRQNRGHEPEEEDTHSRPPSSGVTAELAVRHHEERVAERNLVACSGAHHRSGGGSGWIGPKVKETMNALYNRSDDWRASKEWKEEQRNGPAGSQAAKRAAAAGTFPDGAPRASSAVAAALPDTLGAELGESVGFFTGRDMLPVMVSELESLTSSFRGYQYVVEHTACCMTLVLKAGKGVPCRMILDRSNFMESSCARQADRVAELLKAGIEMRVMKPKGGCFACMHVKTMIIDERVVLAGSVNMTHNGLENNKEHLYRITVPSAVADVVADFDQTWVDAEPVTMEIMNMVLAKATAKAERGKESRRAKSVTRSLSKEIGAAASEVAIEDG
jgi:hypothetical protein